MHVTADLDPPNREEVHTGVCVCGANFTDHTDTGGMDSIEPKDIPVCEQLIGWFWEDIRETKANFGVMS